MVQRDDLHRPGYDLLRIYAYDITDRVQAMAALAYANHKLGILSSITRHDIKNKLTGVLGYLDLLRGSLRDPQLIEFLDKAETSADAIRHHIDFTKDYESLGGTAPVWQEIAPILAVVRSHFDVGRIAFEEPCRVLPSLPTRCLPKCCTTCATTRCATGCMSGT